MISRAFRECVGFEADWEERVRHVLYWGVG